MNYIYILRTREYINSNQNIYKIGKTKQELLKRFKQYPKDSELILQTNCNDCDIVERKLINLFKEKYKHMENIGNEYFEGDINQMKDDIYNETKNNIILNNDIKLNNNITDWSINDIILGGNNQYIKIMFDNDCFNILFLTNDCIKNNRIIKYNKYQIKNNIFINKLVNENKIKLNELYNINDKNFIDILNSDKCRLTINNMDKIIKYCYIDSNIDYTDIITYTSNIYDKILIIFGDTILNNQFVVSFDNIVDNIYYYNLTCKSTIPNINFIDDITINIIYLRNINVIGKIFKKNKEIEVTDIKPYFKYKKIYIHKPINYDNRYKIIIKKLNKITPKNIQSSFFDNHLYQKYYIIDGLSNIINEYYNNSYGYRDKYKNLGLYIDELYSIHIKNICYNDEQYNTLN